MKKVVSLLMITSLGIGLIGCGSNKTANSSQKFDNSQKKETNLTISAAASLTESLNELKDGYEKKTGNKLTFNFASSGQLQKQIEQGAPVDVFISASKAKMDNLEKKNLIVKDSRENLLKNNLVLIVSKEYKDKIKSINDLKNVKGKISIGEPESVPAGKYGKQTLEYYKVYDGLKDRLVLGKSVKQVAQFVESGEAVAGIVFESDSTVLKQSSVAQVIEDKCHKPIIYPVAIIESSKNKEVGKDFIKYLQSKEGQKSFEAHKFVPVKKASK